jgi:autotransporter-associated beta strand protein
MSGGCEAVAGAPGDNIASTAQAISLLGTETQLLSPLGKPVLDSNFGQMLAINNGATAPVRAQALIDALITGPNANVVADGLGATLGTRYRQAANFVSPDDGLTKPKAGQVGPAVAAVIGAVNKTASEGSGEGKCAFANGVEIFEKQMYTLPPSGSYDVIGKAYGHPAGSPLADRYGNSRPFQTAPLDAVSGPRVRTYDGADFFGVATNSRLMLTGATDADKAAGRSGSDLKNSPSFPSGHTTFGYTESLVLAMMVPERYRALAYRGSEYGDSRIVLGAHYPLDVIAGRTLATYDLAHDLAGTPGFARVPGATFRAALAAAAQELRTYLRDACPSIAVCAARDPVIRAENAAIPGPDGLRPATAGEAYRFRLTYGLTPMGPENLPPEPVPAEAATLLETRFPYLTPAQRLDVLRTTEGPSGHFLDVSPLDGRSPAAEGPGSEAGVYSRLDLYAAAGGYTTLADQVVVVQDAASLTDPDLRPFLDLARTDTWSNNIGGPGGLTKRGDGKLILTGENTYRGPTIVEGGTLEVAGSIAGAARVEAGGTLAGVGRIGEVTVTTSGRLAPGSADGATSLDVEGSLTLNPGAAYVARVTGAGVGAFHVQRIAKLEGAHLKIEAGATVRPGVRYTLVEAKGGVQGRFADVASSSPSLVPTLTYAAEAVYLTFQEKAADARPN